MAHCVIEEYRSIQPVKVRVKRHLISVQLSTSVKAREKGGLTRDSIDKGYKRIISETNILVEKKPHYKKASWNAPRAKELRASFDGEKWYESTSKELTGLYVDYKGDNGKWNSFIENGKLVKNDKIEYAFVDAIDTRQKR